VRKKVLFEDVTMQYNKWVSGIASREFNAQRLKFRDLVGQNFDTDQNPNTAKADNVLPYQLVNAARILGDLLSNTSNAITEFKNALENPVVKKDEDMQKEINQTIFHLENSLEDLQHILRGYNHDKHKQEKSEES
jgi:hypothetical protein